MFPQDQPLVSLIFCKTFSFLHFWVIVFISYKTLSFLQHLMFAATLCLFLTTLHFWVIVFIFYKTLCLLQHSLFPTAFCFFWITLHFWVILLILYKNLCFLQHSSFVQLYISSIMGNVLNLLQNSLFPATFFICCNCIFFQDDNAVILCFFDINLWFG